MDLQKLQDPLERQLALLGFELVWLESAKEGRDEVLRLYIDHLDHAKGGITLDDCVAANDGLVSWLDVTFPSLREDLGLEISSPGLERPLTKPAHYRRFQGRLCRVQTGVPQDGQKRFKGWIVSADDTAVTLEEDGKLKTVPFEAIQKARLAPFDEPKAPQPKIARADAGREAGSSGACEAGDPHRASKQHQHSNEQAGAEKSAGEEA